MRVFLFADYGKIHAPFSIDVTTGDKITPSEIDYSYKRLFDKDCIQIKSYPLETVMAEKLETILSRNIANTREKHQKQLLNKTFLVRESGSDNLVAFYSLKAATLPYNEKESSFLIPAIELTHFAVDERYKTVVVSSSALRIGEFIFWNHIVPGIKKAQEYLALQGFICFFHKYTKIN